VGRPTRIAKCEISWADGIERYRTQILTIRRVLWTNKLELRKSYSIPQTSMYKKPSKVKIVAAQQ
jgi:hypothetical protein